MVLRLGDMLESSLSSEKSDGLADGVLPGYFAKAPQRPSLCSQVWKPLPLRASFMQPAVLRPAIDTPLWNYGLYV